MTKVISPYHVRFGKTLRDLRNDRDLTQEMLAAKIDVDRSYIGFLERGEGNPSLTLLMSLAKVLGVKPYELIK